VKIVSPRIDASGIPRMAMVIIGPRAATNDPFGEMKKASSPETEAKMIRKTMPATRRAKLKTKNAAQFFRQALKLSL
jgi:hypothetical protein